jgi:hypothetical protein
MDGWMLEILMDWIMFMFSTIVKFWFVTHSQVPGWTHLRVQLCWIAKSWNLRGAPDFQHNRGVEGHARSPGIRLRRWTRRSSLNLHPKPTTRELVSIQEHPWMLGQATGNSNYLIHHSPTSGEATTFPHIVFSASHHGGYIRMALFLGTLKLESRNCPRLESWDFGLS